MATPRWHGDEIGTGIGDAGDFAPHVRRLLEEMVEPDWVVEDPHLHLLPQLRRELESPGSPWRLIDHLVANAVFTVTLEWARRDGTLQELRRDAFVLVGTVAKQVTHVAQYVRIDRIEFDVVTGVLEGESRFRRHGHMLRLQVTGEAARRLLPDLE
jgi:hypothetical protein